MTERLMIQFRACWERLFRHIGQGRETRLLYSYRYASLLITSTYYFLHGSTSLLPVKLVTVLSLCIFARLTTDLYVKHADSPRKLQVLIILETLIITLLLAPTGGLDSPFIWYALNPVLVAAWYLTPLSSWFTLTFYLFAVLRLSAVFFEQGEVLASLVKHSYLTLVLVLITLLVQQLASLSRHLSQANCRQQEFLEHILSLYKIIETISNRDNLESFFQTFTDQIAKLTKSDLAFFWQRGENAGLGTIFASMPISTELENGLILELEAAAANQQRNATFMIQLGENIFEAVLVKSVTRIYGVIGISCAPESEAIQGADSPGPRIFFGRQLGFLSDLSTIVLERLSSEENNEKLLLLEERNRIAGEIHDSVAQRLFSIKCALHVLCKKWKSLAESETNAQLVLIQETASAAGRELRESIYRLSTQKSGEKVFFPSINTYLVDLAQLNHIRINSELSGEEAQLSGRVKKCLYRVICEATGNAVKHSGCTLIKLSLEVEGAQVTLRIADNGLGFVHSDLSLGLGLGLNNMRNLVQAMGGDFVLRSIPRAGTEVQVRIPTREAEVQGKGGIA